MRSCDMAGHDTLDEDLTLGEAIGAAAAAFDAAGLVFGHGTGNAGDEAHWLLLETLGLSPLAAPDYARRLSDADTRRCNAQLARRIVDREPVAFITGRAWFAGLEFRCDRRALVPRSPLAEWIDGDFYSLLPVDEQLEVLDLCTGGGAIAIACAMALPHARVDASDLSADALSLARENIALHGLESRVTPLHGSLFEPVRGPYDLIVSNPPYVDAADMEHLAAEYLHEPAMALGAGDDGLDLVRLMVQQAAAHLKPDGLLVVEVGNSAPALEAAFPELAFLWLEFAAGGDGVFVLSRDELVSGLSRGWATGPT